MAHGLAVELGRRARRSLRLAGGSGVIGGALLSVTLLAAPANNCNWGGTGGTGGTGGGSADSAEFRSFKDAASRNGSYAVASYSSGFDSPAFGAATIYYPNNGPSGLAGVAVSPGFTETQANMSGWGRFLASHGFVVICFDTNNPLENPQAREQALLAAVDVLKRENTRGGSPLAGKMSSDRYAIMGHSMGGGGTLLAARNPRSDIKAAIPLTPWNIGTPLGVTKPTLLVAAQNDVLANVNSMTWPFYQAVPANLSKAYIEFAGADHFVANDPTNTFVANTRYVASYGLAWLKVYLHGDTNYKRIIESDPDPNTGTDGIFSRYDNQVK